MYIKPGKETNGLNIAFKYDEEHETVYFAVVDTKKGAFAIEKCDIPKNRSRAPLWDGRDEIEVFPEDIYVMKNGDGYPVSYLVKNDSRYPVDVVFTSSLRKIETVPTGDEGSLSPEGDFVIPFAKEERFAGFAKRGATVREFIPYPDVTIFHYDEKNLDFPVILFSSERRIALLFPKRKELRSFVVTPGSLEIEGEEVEIYPRLVPFGDGLHAAVARSGISMEIRIFKERGERLKFVGKKRFAVNEFPFVGFLSGEKLLVAGSMPRGSFDNGKHSFLGEYVNGRFRFEKIEGLTVPMEPDDFGVSLPVYDVEEFYIDEEGVLVAKVDDGPESGKRVIISEKGALERPLERAELELERGAVSVYVKGIPVNLSERRVEYVDPETGKFVSKNLLPEGETFVPMKYATSPEERLKHSSWLVWNGEKSELSTVTLRMDEKGEMEIGKRRDYRMEDVVEECFLAYDKKEGKPEFAVKYASVEKQGEVRIYMNGKSRDSRIFYDDFLLVPTKEGYMPAYRMLRYGNGFEIFDNFLYIEERSAPGVRPSPDRKTYESPENTGGFLYIPPSDGGFGEWREIPVRFSKEARSGIVANTGKGYVVMETLDSGAGDTRKLRAFALDEEGNRLTEDAFFGNGNFELLDGTGTVGNVAPRRNMFSVPVYDADMREKGTCFIVANATEEEGKRKSLFFIFEGGTCRIVSGRELAIGKRDAGGEEVIGLIEAYGNRFVLSRGVKHGGYAKILETIRIRYELSFLERCDEIRKIYLSTELRPVGHTERYVSKFDPGKSPVMSRSFLTAELEKERSLFGRTVKREAKRLSGYREREAERASFG